MARLNEQDRTRLRVQMQFILRQIQERAKEGEHIVRREQARLFGYRECLQIIDANYEYQLLEDLREEFEKI